jgi:hypothetical protein
MQLLAVLGQHRPLGDDHQPRRPGNHLVARPDAIPDKPLDQIIAFPQIMHADFLSRRHRPIRLALQRERLSHAAYRSPDTGGS